MRSIMFSMTYSATSVPISVATSQAVRKWIPAKTRASATSASASEKLEKDRVQLRFVCD